MTAAAALAREYTLPQLRCLLDAARWSDAEWRDLIEQFADTGLSVVEISDLITLAVTQEVN